MHKPNVRQNYVTTALSSSTSQATQLQTTTSSTSSVNPFPTYNCPSDAYFVAKDEYGRINLTSGAFTALNTDITRSGGSVSLNAMGYNPTDNYIYGVTSQNVSSKLVRISANSSSIVLESMNFTDTTASLVGGEVDQNGIFWVFKQSGSSVTVYQLDLAYNSPTYGTTLQVNVTNTGNFSVTDWTLIPTASGPYNNSLVSVQLRTLSCDSLLTFYSTRSARTK